VGVGCLRYGVNLHFYRKTAAGEIEIPFQLSAHARLTSKLPERIILLLYAVAIGVVAGYGAVGFRKLIQLFDWLFFHVGTSYLRVLGRGEVIIFPVIGLVIVSMLVRRFAPEAKGHGVPEVMAAIAERGGVIRPRVVVVKAVASALTIGSGGSVGREGPIVQIGSAFGSVFGQMLGVPKRYLRLMVACGAGAGIAATFNAPIGGVMFAAEVILGSFALENFTAIMMSSVVSAAIGRIYLGNHPSFDIPIHDVGPFRAYWVYVLLGLVSGLWGTLYVKVLYRVEDWFDARRWPFWVKAVVGGIAVGVIGVWFPQIFGVGYGTIDRALSAHLPLYLLGTLLVLKLLATSITIGAGGSGGVFSPGLYQGAMLGGLVGVMLSHAHIAVSPGALAAIGMAGVFAGSAQAPVTSITMLFEMTGDYSMILPLMITSVLSATVAGLISPQNIYTMKLFRRGLDIVRLREPDRMKALTVGDVIQENRLVFDAHTSIETAWGSFAKTSEWFALVRDAKRGVVGSVARVQVVEALRADRGGEPIHNLLPAQMVRIDERASLAEALALMNEHGVTYLLVCRGDVGIGVVGSSDVIRAYRRVD